MLNATTSNGLSIKEEGNVFAVLCTASNGSVDVIGRFSTIEKAEAKLAEVASAFSESVNEFTKGIDTAMDLHTEQLPAEAVQAIKEMNAAIKATEQPTEVATIVTGHGMWQHPIAVKKALCQDGKRRAVRLNQDGQTGRCTIGKKTVKGFISYVEQPSCNTSGVTDYQFIAFSDQK